MSSEIVGPLERRAEKREKAGRRTGRELTIEFLGPLTILGGIVWAILQPYRIVFLDSGEKSLYDYVFQAPLLVIVVGLVFTFLIAPGLTEDLRKVHGTES